MISRKYGRTAHYGFSPGTTSDDRLNHEWWEDVQKIDTIMHTEKLDGENTCISQLGVFSRSHAVPTTHPWADWLKPIQQRMQADLKSENLEIFGENLYAMHSIAYPELENHFFVFGMRIGDTWLSWEQVKWYADFFELKTAPVLGVWRPKFYTKESYQKGIEMIVSHQSEFGSLHHLGPDAGKICTMEGLVSRNVEEFSVGGNGSINKENVFKWVRKGHVQTDEHWTKGWKRAPLVWENKKEDAKG